MVNSGRAKHASLGGVWGLSPQKCFEKISALRLILVGFGNQALTTVVIAPIPVSQVQVTVVIGTGDCG